MRNRICPAGFRAWIPLVVIGLVQSMSMAVQAQTLRGPSYATARLDAGVVSTSESVPALARAGQRSAGRTGVPGPSQPGIVFSDENRTDLRLSTGERRDDGDGDLDGGAFAMAEEREELREQAKLNPALTAEEREAREQQAAYLRGAQDAVSGAAIPEARIYRDSGVIAGVEPMPMTPTVLRPPFRPTVYEEDPYAALGVRLRGFLVYPEVLIEAVGSDNVTLSSQDRNSDVAIEFRPSVIVESDWSRHALRGEFRSVYSDHRTYSSEDEESLTLKLKGRIDVTHRTKLEGEAEYERSQEAQDSVDLPANAVERSDVEYYRIAGSLSQRFNRLTATFRGAVLEYDYEDVAVGGGGIANNDDRDYREQKGTVRLAYDFRPGLSAFGEGEFSERDYRMAVGDDGYRRSGDGYALRGGIAVDIGPKLKGEVSVGFAHQGADDARLLEADGVVADANLLWRISALTSLSLEARSKINETTLGAAAGNFSRYVSLEGRHAPRRYLILTAGVSFEDEDFEGANVTQQTLIANSGAEYIFTRSLAVIGRYQFTQQNSSVPNSSYQENEVRLGLRVRR